MLICGKAERSREGVGAADLGRPVRAAVQLQDLVVEVLDAQTQSGHADAANRRELGLGERPRLALEGDLLGVLPWRHGGQPADQAFELLRREERGRAAAEVDEVQRPSGDRRLRRAELPLAREHVEIIVDLLRVLVGVHAEIAEVAPLPAERECAGTGRAARRWPGAVSSAIFPSLDRGRRPGGERRIGGDEITPDFGLIVQCG